MDGMQLHMLRGPTSQRSGPNLGVNYLLLKDAVESTQEVCNALVVYLNHAATLSLDELPLEVPFVLTGDRMRLHSCGIAGSFECVKCVDANDVVLIPYGVDDTGAQIMKPPPLPPVPLIPINPALQPNAGGSPNAPNVSRAPGAAPGQDLNTI